MFCNRAASQRSGSQGAAVLCQGNPRAPRGAFARPARIASAAAMALLLSACGEPGPDHPSVAYREAESVESLEVPPDLTKPNAPGALNVPSEDETAENAEASQQVLPQFDGVRFVRAGTSAWVELEQVSPDALWSRLEGFVQGQGLEIAQADASLGIVETEWAERQSGPSRGGLLGLIGGIFGGGDAVQDRYQFSLERMDGGGTRVLVAHRSAEEIAQERERRRAVGASGSDREFAWRRATGDPALQREMTKRLLVYLGMAEERADGVIADGRGAAALGAAAQYFENRWGRAWIVVEDPGVRRVFARTGDALEAIDAQIEQADAEQRRYGIQWSPDEDAEGQALAVFVRGGDGATQITAGDAEGGERSGDVHKALLRELTGALGGDPDEIQQPEEPEADERERGRPRSIMSPRRER